jgi:hypothetical protein
MTELIALYNTKKRTAKQWAAQKQAVLDYKAANPPEQLCLFVMALDTRGAPEDHTAFLTAQIDAAFAEEVLEDQVLDYGDGEELTLRHWTHKGLHYRLDEESHQVYHCDVDLNVGVYIEDCDTLDFYDDNQDQPGSPASGHCSDDWYE